MKKICILLLTTIILVSCGSKKTMVKETTPTTVDNASTPEAKKQHMEMFVKRVFDNSQTVRDISSKIDFRIQQGSKDISVSGKIQMRKDEVIRIQLNVPLLGMEAGRLEFTKDYAMIVDRIHSQYVQGDYNEISFLKDKGLNFSTLQSLFWNELFLLGKDKVTDASLSAYEVTMGPVESILRQAYENMNCAWTTETASGKIERADVVYTSKQHGNTSVSCDYDDFQSLNGKLYPNKLVLNMSSGALSKGKNLMMEIKMKGISTDGGWDSFTTVSKKYKKVKAEDVLKQLMSL